MLLGTLAPITAFAGFTDVPTSHPHKLAIEWARKQKIVGGYADGTFRPDVPVNRAELTKIVIGANFTSQALSICDPGAIYTYRDAGHTEWYAPYLCIATQHQIVRGYPDGRFQPDANITAVEAAKIVAVTSQNRNGVRGPDAMNFEATDGQEWFEPYISYLKQRKALPPALYDNTHAVTRGEMVEMLYRLSENFTAPSNSGWKTYEDIHGIFSLQLPTEWKALSAYDGSAMSFTKLGDGVLGYGEEHGEQISLETLREQDIRLQPGEDLRSFAINRYTTPSARVYPGAERGIPLTEIVIDHPTLSMSYVLFECEDAIIMLGYRSPSTITTAIRGSFACIDKERLR